MFLLYSKNFTFQLNPILKNCMASMATGRENYTTETKLQQGEFPKWNKNECNQENAGILDKTAV